MVGEKTYLLRIPPELYAEIRKLAEQQERSANWVMVRLLRKAMRESPTWKNDATR